MGRVKWQRLTPFEKLADTLLRHLEGILNYCRSKVRFGVVEAVNGNICMLINHERAYKNLRYLLLKAKRRAVTNVEFSLRAEKSKSFVWTVDGRSDPR
jgi:hypothetical protein